MLIVHIKLKNSKREVPAVSSSSSSISLRSAASSFRSSVGKGFPSAVKTFHRILTLKFIIASLGALSQLKKKPHACFQIPHVTSDSIFFWFPPLSIPSNYFHMYYIFNIEVKWKVNSNLFLLVVGYFILQFRTLLFYWSMLFHPLEGGTQSSKEDVIPSKASLIFRFFSYSKRSLPSKLFLYKYSLLSRMFLRNIALNY